MNTSKINTILFDLDGTLLPFNERTFMEGYITLFALKCQEIGIDDDRGVSAFFDGLAAMRTNDGSVTNEKIFWKAFFATLGGYNEEMVSHFINFYTNEFPSLIGTTFPSPLSKKIIKVVKEKGYRLVLATTPVFPRVGTLERMKWAGLNPMDFEIITTFEEYSHTKQQLGYYYQIFSEMGIQGSEVLMIGNNIAEDGIIMQTGAKCVFVADHLINDEDEDIENLEIYSLSGLYEFVKTLPQVYIQDELL